MLQRLSCTASSAGLAFFDLDDSVEEVFQHIVAVFFTLIVYVP